MIINWLCWFLNVTVFSGAGFLFLDGKQNLRMSHPVSLRKWKIPFRWLVLKYPKHCKLECVSQVMSTNKTNDPEIPVKGGRQIYLLVKSDGFEEKIFFFDPVCLGVSSYCGWGWGFPVFWKIKRVQSLRGFHFPLSPALFILLELPSPQQLSHCCGLVWWISRSIFSLFCFFKFNLRNFNFFNLGWIFFAQQTIIIHLLLWL